MFALFCPIFPFVTFEVHCVSSLFQKFQKANISFSNFIFVKRDGEWYEGVVWGFYKWVGRVWGRGERLLEIYSYIYIYIYMFIVQ